MVYDYLVPGTIGIITKLFPLQAKTPSEALGALGWIINTNTQCRAIYKGMMRGRYEPFDIEWRMPYLPATISFMKTCRMVNDELGALLYADIMVFSGSTLAIHVLLSSFPRLYKAVTLLHVTGGSPKSDWDPSDYWLLQTPKKTTNIEKLYLDQFSRTANDQKTGTVWTMGDLVRMKRVLNSTGSLSRIWAQPAEAWFSSYHGHEVLFNNFDDGDGSRYPVAIESERDYQKCLDASEQMR